MLAPAVLLSLPYVTATAIAFLCADVAPDRLGPAAAAAALLAVIAGAGFYLEEDATGVAVALTIGALAAGYAGGASAARDTYGPSLLTWFEREDPQEPVVVEGWLREDAVGESPMLHLEVERITGGDGVQHHVSGGVRLFLGGSPAGNLVAC